MLDLSKPLYDQSTYTGRLKHFARLTNPLNLFASDAHLREARTIVESYMKGDPSVVAYTQPATLWRSKYLADSAFHPETGEKMNLIGRMSAQVPCNMVITGFMMTFYKTNASVFMWQWINQSFNALVNYTNRSGSTAMTNRQIIESYVVATSAATVTALGVKSLVKSFPPLVARFVPFTAVAAANCVNIPFMRYSEIRDGVAVFDAGNVQVGESSAAAKKGVATTVLSRIFMCTPGMILPPFLMERLEKRPVFIRYPMLSAIVQIGLVGIFLSFMTPAGCALFDQRSSISVKKVEDPLRSKLVERGYKPYDKLYFNKGL
ncbi:hypothetical protein ACOME3_000080 [Neoechinorhynchus agilis]